MLSIAKGFVTQVGGRESGNILRVATIDTLQGETTA
jgi:hypothetical protein